MCVRRRIKVWKTKELGIFSIRMKFKTLVFVTKCRRKGYMRGQIYFFIIKNTSNGLPKRLMND